MDSIQELQQRNVNYNGAQSNKQQQQQCKKAYVKILEQPAGKALRFRYKCEGRSAGSIPGASSTPENKTYPTIEIVGYTGRAVVVVSCVTKDQPYRPHPHNIVGKEGCEKGVCTIKISPQTQMRAVFSNLGIQCVKKRDIEAALKAREEIRVDPFKTGFTHRLHPAGIDLNSVRLCFQVFTEGDKTDSFTHPLPPVISEPIYDKKVKSDLVICRLCSCSATVLGNTEIILLCEKVAKEDISVRFFEEKNGQIVWEAFGEFHQTDVHKQTAIAFRTPRYHQTNITEPAKVLIQLKRPSDGATSAALPFEYIPLASDPVHLKRKRQRSNGDPAILMLAQDQHQNNHEDDQQAKRSCWNATNPPAVKVEPMGASAQPFGVHQVRPDIIPSPQRVSLATTYLQNTPSSYRVTPTVPIPVQSRQPMVSPNQQYCAARAGASMDTNYYQQTQQQHHRHHYNDSNFGTTGTHWESNLCPAAESNISDLRSNNLTTLHNISAPANVSGVLGPNPNPNASWNLTSHNFHPHHLQHQYAPHPQQSDSLPVNNNNNSVVKATRDAATKANGVNKPNNTTENCLSNLLNIDSEQYVHINSEDQEMLRLNSEDLRISDLSIS